MRAFGDKIVSFKGLVILFIMTLLGTVIQAQTNLNDVHIVPRAKASTLGFSNLAGSGLHVLKTDVSLVLVPVTVTDPMQRLVTGLQQENFQIFEGKEQQEIRHFSAEDVPTTIGFVVDISGSMGDKLGRVQEAVNQFCETANPRDEFFMITFSDEPSLVTDFTFTPEKLEESLLSLRARGRTALLDAIYMGLHKMKEATYGKKALSLPWVAVRCKACSRSPMSDVKS